MQPTVLGLLNNAGLGLRLLAGDDSSKLSEPVSWIHSSDLADPTPFLDAGHLVLTTGTQFEAATAATFSGYVERLADHGILGIGFGSEVIRAETPDGLIAACDGAGMPLFEVPYRVPFIAVVRSVADLIAEAAHARDTWALNAQRAISFAALKPDAVASVLAELSRQLGRWVALYDYRGQKTVTVDEASVLVHLDVPELMTRVDAEAGRLIARGQRSSSTISDTAGQVSLQTLGRRGELRGVLVIAGAEPLDAADQSVVTSVVALVGLAIEQARELGRTHGRLRGGLFQALLEGNVAFVQRIVSRLGGVLPTEPVRVVALEVPQDSRDALVSELDVRPGGEPFLAAEDGRVYVCVAAEDAVTLADELSLAHSLAVGISDPLPLAATATGVEQAVRALDKAGVASVLEFGALVSGSLAGLLRDTSATELARALLRPVREHDAATGMTLVESARVWLEHNGSWDPAAKQLGIHRHTLKSRVGLVEKLTGRELQSFEARTNLWLALQLE
ncbi:PucR family transcriptional regulator [Mycetocola zhujimingii]|uniref:PucR family transcriptional regulator n=1 Tax=Mycetocola zhujimingii TaxID=2079792 RepID=A0A2U1TA85_9MICO|nr:PucR family transcriptional regulator [Mycetocola zhujimingii]PWC04605.1 PucR family transcriptional regulator [Mycetocola zhujimingii]